jgi:hypothetical protein
MIYNKEYENGYPTKQLIIRLADVLGVKRQAITYSDGYGEKNGILFYKESIAERSLETFAKFLIYNRIDVKEWNATKIILNKIQ